MIIIKEINQYILNLLVYKFYGLCIDREWTTIIREKTGNKKDIHPYSHVYLFTHTYEYTYIHKHEGVYEYIHEYTDNRREREIGHNTL